MVTGSGDLRNLQGMGESGYIMGTKWSDEDLRLILEVFEAAKHFRVDNTVPVTLEGSTHRT